MLVNSRTISRMNEVNRPFNSLLRHTTSTRYEFQAKISNTLRDRFPTPRRTPIRNLLTNHTSRRRRHTQSRRIRKRISNIQETRAIRRHVRTLLRSQRFYRTKTRRPTTITNDRHFGHNHTNKRSPQNTHFPNAVNPRLAQTRRHSIRIQIRRPRQHNSRRPSHPQSSRSRTITNTFPLRYHIRPSKHKFNRRNPDQQCQASQSTLTFINS